LLLKHLLKSEGTMKNKLLVMTVMVLALGAVHCGTDSPFARGEKDADGSSHLKAADVGNLTPQEFYQKNVHPILAKKCMGCHSGGFTNYTVTSDAAADYPLHKLLIVPKDLTASALYQKPLGNGHGGGKLWSAQSDEANNMGLWIMSESP
jgi:hypothetical protein